MIHWVVVDEARCCMIPSKRGSSPFTSTCKLFRFSLSTIHNKVCTLFAVKLSRFYRGLSKYKCPLGCMNSIPISAFFCSPCDSSLNRRDYFSNKRKNFITICLRRSRIRV